MIYITNKFLNNGISKIFGFFIFFAGCFHVTLPTAQAVSARLIISTLLFQSISLHFHILLVLLFVFALAQDCRLSQEYGSTNKTCFSLRFYLYPHTASILKNDTNCQIALSCPFFNILGILLKIPANTALMLTSATALEHEGGNMIRLSILESKKQ